MSNRERAVLAGGCFWGMQDLIRKRKGVLETRVGYTGGDVPNATYKNHGSHAEGIEIIYDPDQTSFRELLEFFFQIHDPTTPNRQGNDLGTSYRSAIYYVDENQKAGALAGKGCDRAFTGGGFLGGGARAPGLFGAPAQWLYLSFCPPRLGTAETGQSG